MQQPHAMQGVIARLAATAVDVQTKPPTLWAIGAVTMWASMTSSGIHSGGTEETR